MKGYTEAPRGHTRSQSPTHSQQQNKGPRTKRKSRLAHAQFKIRALVTVSISRPFPTPQPGPNPQETSSLERRSTCRGHRGQPSPCSLHSRCELPSARPTKPPSIPSRIPGRSLRRQDQGVSTTALLPQCAAAAGRTLAPDDGNEKLAAPCGSKRGIATTARQPGSDGCSFWQTVEDAVSA